MKINVRGHIRDLLAFRGLLPKRIKRIARAAPHPVDPGVINELAQQLHPSKQSLVVAEVKDETKSTKTFRLVADPDAGGSELAFFRAGQYLSLKVEVAGVNITRPYSISSAPCEAMGSGGFYDITIKEKQDGFLTPYIWDQWGEGTKVESSGPHGFFYYEPLRDERQIVGLAGGAGITPFHSMAREIAYGDLDVELLVLHGSAEEDDIIFYDEFKQLEKETNGKVQIVHVLSCAEVSLAGCEQGFITTDIVEKYANIDRSSVFICGPAAMHSFADQELAPFNLPHRRVRRESLGQIEDVAQLPGYPKDIAGETFRLVVRVGGEVVDIPAMAAETVLVAVERANLAPPSRCRSGECGFCRSRLISGEVYVNPDGDGRRGADRQFGYIHPCSSYPTSDLEIEVL